MDFWIPFIFVFLLIHSLQLHYRAAKRIRALDKQVEDLYQEVSNLVSVNIELADMICTLADRSTQDGQEIMAIRTNLLKHTRKNNDSTR